MEGKLITTEGLKAYTQQLKTWIGGIYQTKDDTKADMALYTKTADLFTYLDTRYIAKDSPVYGNPIYKHIIYVFSANNFRIKLTIFTTRANTYIKAGQFRKDWVEDRKIISVLADASNNSTVFIGTVVGVIAASNGIAIRINGIQAGGTDTASNWDAIYTLNEWSYVNNPSRI